MSWSEHLNRVGKTEKLLYWVLLSIVNPSKNLPLDFYFEDVLSVGLSGDPGWSIEKIKDGIDASYEVCDGDGYIEEAGHVKRYSEVNLRIALRDTLQEVSQEFPERTKEAIEVMRRWHL
jgi:hypothetical protein